MSSLRNGVLYQANYTRERETAGALQQAAAIAALLEPPHRHLVQAWLCMVAQPEMRAVTRTGVRICGIETLHDAVGILPEVLDADAVKVIHQYLTRLLAADASPALLTTASLEKDGRRARRHTSPRPTTTGQRRAGRALVGCLGLILALFVLLFVSGLLIGLFENLTHPASRTIPRPTPAVTRLIPSPYPVTR